MQIEIIFETEALNQSQKVENSINYMSDNELLVILGIICISLMIVIKFLNGFQVFLIHFVIWGLYTLFMLYGLTFEGRDGTSIVWFSILAISYTVYIILMTTYIIFKLIKKMMKRFKQFPCSREDVTDIFVGFCNSNTFFHFKRQPSREFVTHIVAQQQKIMQKRTITMPMSGLNSIGYKQV